jgi:hypothetical protein
LNNRRPGSMYLVLLLLTSALFISVSAVVTPNVWAETFTLTPASGSPPVAGLLGTTVTIGGSVTAATGDATCVITAVEPGLILDTPSCSLSGTGTTRTVYGTFKVGAGSTYASAGYTFTITTYPSGTANTATHLPVKFYVDARIVLSPTSGGAGTTVSIAGSGFKSAAADCTIQSTIKDSPSTCQQGTGGEIAGVFTVKSGWPAGLYLVRVADVSATPVASKDFQITGGPTLVLSNNYQGYTGTPIIVTGSGYSTTAGLVDTYVDLQEGSTDPAGGSTNLWGVPTKIRCAVSGGSITYLYGTASACQFTVKSNALGRIPTATPPLYTVYALGQFGDLGRAEFVVLSKFELTPETGGRGILVILSGSGFTSGAPTACTPTLIPALPLLYVGSTSCSVDAFGILTGYFYVDPGASLITYTVRLTDIALVVQGSVSDTFAVTGATLLLTPGFGFTGQVVTVSGSGWSLSDTSVRLTSPTMPDGSSSLWGAPYPLICPVSGGSITSCTFTVRPDALGNAAGYTVTGTGIPYSDLTSAVFSVQSRLVVTPESAGGAVVVTLSGSGYTGTWANCRAEVTSNPASPTPWSTAQVDACSVDANGHLAGSFTVRDYPTTFISYTITITDATHVIPGSASDTFTVLAPSITLDPDHGGTGSAVTLTGTDFSLRDTSCSILW